MAIPVKQNVNNKTMKHLIWFMKCLKPEFEKNYASAIDFKKEKLNELALLLSKNDTEAEAALIDTLLRDFRSLWVSAMEANSKLKPHNRVKIHQCYKTAKAINLSLIVSEEVQVRALPKKSGGYRMVHNFGIMHRAVQHLINCILGKYLKPQSFQFTRKGVPKAVNCASKLIADGYIYSSHLDIKEFYQGFSEDALIKSLPLPKDVVEHAVVGRLMEVCIDKKSISAGLHEYESPHSDHALLNLARQGIPAGSSTSSIVSMMAISKLNWSPIMGVEIINYADDFLVLAKSEALLKEGLEALIASVAKLPDGHFTLVLKEQASIADGICFLGHQFCLVEGVLEITPSQASVEKMFKKLCQIESEIQALSMKQTKGKQTKFLTRAAELYASINGYKAAFYACTPCQDSWFVVMELNLKSTLKILGVSQDQVKAAVKPWMRPENFWYMFKD